MEAIFKRLHVIGRQEVGLILGGVGKVPDGSPAREECAEANIPEAFGTSADGTLMRTLQEFSFYMDDGVPAPIEALDDKFSKRKIKAFGTVLPADYVAPPRKEKKEKEGKDVGLTPAASGSSLTGAAFGGQAMSPNPAPSLAVAGAGDKKRGSGSIRLKIRLRPEHMAGGAGGGGEGGGGDGAAMKRLRVLGEEGASAQRGRSMEEGEDEGEDGREDWDSVGLRVVIPEITEWCIDYVLGGEAVLWVVSSAGVWYKLSGTSFSFLHPHPLYARMYRSAGKKFKLCALTAMHLVNAYREKPTGTYQEILEVIIRETQGKVKESALLENADFVGKQMAALSDPAGGDAGGRTFGACSFIEGLKAKARAQGTRPITKKERDKMAKEVGKVLRQLIQGWVEGGRGHGGGEGGAEEEVGRWEHPAGSPGGMEDFFGQGEGLPLKGGGDNYAVVYPGQAGGPGMEGGQITGLEGAKPSPLPYQEGGFLGESSHEWEHKTAMEEHEFYEPSYQYPEPSPNSSLGGGGIAPDEAGEEEEEASRSSTTIKLKMRTGPGHRYRGSGGWEGGRRDGGYRYPEGRPEVDDLVLLGEEAQVPRPPGQPASSLLPAALFPSVLTAWNTLQLCGPATLRLSPFPLSWLEQAVTTTVKGLIPDLIQETFHRLLAVVLNDRKDPSRPVSVCVLGEEYDEEEKGSGGGREGGREGGYGMGGEGGGSRMANRSVETLESVLYRGARAEQLLPYGWQELTRLLIAERFHLPLETYLDPLGELQRLLEDLAQGNKASLPFFHRVDPAKDDMPGYASIVEEPMDLGTIVQRLKTGWYEEEAIHRGKVLGEGQEKEEPTQAKQKEEQMGEAGGEAPKEEENGREAADPLPAGSGVEDTAQTVPSTAAAGETVPSFGSRGLSTRSKGRGAKGVLDDVRLVWVNCEQYHGPDAALTEVAQALSEELEEKIQTRVLEPLERRAKWLAGEGRKEGEVEDGKREEEDRVLGLGGDGEGEDGGVAACTTTEVGSKLTSSLALASAPDIQGWKTVVDQLGRLTFAELPVKTRVMVLRWLADEVASSATVRELLENVAGAREPYRKMAARRTAFRAQKAHMAAQQQAAQASGYAPPPSPANLEGWTQADEREFLRVSELALKDLRLRPLGVDRFHRRYWTFPGDKKHAVYAEDEADGPVTVVYRSKVDLIALIRWLSDRTLREGALRSRVIELTERYYPDGPDLTQAINVPSSPVPNGEGAVNGRKSTEPADAFCRYQSAYAGVNLPSEQQAMMPDLYRYICYPLGITARERGCLGLVYADQELKLTAYRDHRQNLVRTPPFPRMGINVDDRIVLVNGKLIDGPKWPAGAVEDESTLVHLPGGETEEFQLMILREAGGAQTSINVQQLPPRVTCSEWNFVQGWLLHLEREMCHPLAIGPDWEGSGAKARWRQMVMRALDGEKTKAESLRKAALELEGRLRACGTVLSKEDREGRAKGTGGKWRQYMSLAQTPSQLLLGLRLLHSLLDRRVLNRALQSMERAAWQALLPKEKSIELPDVGSFVIYYPQGHKAAMRHNARFQGPMWNVEGPHEEQNGAAAGAGAVQVCQVHGIEYHAFDPTAKDPFASSAWARVKLARLNEPAYHYFYPERKLRLYRPVEPRASLSRLLARVVLSAMELREADQFCEPVDRNEYPDYYEMIWNPMDFTTLLSRVRRHMYGELSTFLKDLELISRNCHAYCDARFPTLPVLADQVVGVAKETVKYLEHKIRKAEKEIRVLCERSNFNDVIPYVKKEAPLEEMFVCDRSKPPGGNRPKSKASGRTTPNAFGDASPSASGHATPVKVEGNGSQSENSEGQGEARPRPPTESTAPPTRAASPMVATAPSPLSYPTATAPLVPSAPATEAFPSQASPSIPPPQTAGSFTHVFPAPANGPTPPSSSSAPAPTPVPAPAPHPSSLPQPQPTPTNTGNSWLPQQHPQQPPPQHQPQQYQQYQHQPASQPQQQQYQHQPASQPQQQPPRPVGVPYPGGGPHPTSTSARPAYSQPSAIPPALAKPSTSHTPSTAPVSTLAPDIGATMPVGPVPGGGPPSVYGNYAGQGARPPPGPSSGYYNTYSHSYTHPAPPSSAPSTSVAGAQSSAPSPYATGYPYTPSHPHPQAGGESSAPPSSYAAPGYSYPTYSTGSAPSGATAYPGYHAPRPPPSSTSSSSQPATGTSSTQAAYQYAHPHPGTATYQHLPPSSAHAPAYRHPEHPQQQPPPHQQQQQPQPQRKPQGSPAGTPAGQHPPQQPPQQMATPKVVETFYVGVWLLNSVPEFMVSRPRYEQALKRTWRKEDRFDACWSSEDVGEEGSVYSGTVIGARPPDPVTGLLPWTALQMERDSGKVDFVNPWNIDVLPSDGGPVVPGGKLEYHGMYDLYKHHHSLLDRPRDPEMKDAGLDVLGPRGPGVYAPPSYSYHPQQQAYQDHPRHPPTDSAAAGAQAQGYAAYSSYPYGAYTGYAYGSVPGGYGYP